MATNSLDTSYGIWQVIDKRANPAGGSATNPASSTTYNAMKDMTATDAQLVTLNAGYWTQARLDSTCLSDKLYALRLGYDAAGIS